MRCFVTGVFALTTTILCPLGGSGQVRAEPPVILQFRIQEKNQKTYFHLRLQQPADLALEAPASRLLERCAVGCPFAGRAWCRKTTRPAWWIRES